jgi:hypothetical protein
VSGADRCTNCDRPLDPERTTCPYCRAPRAASIMGGLARASGDGAIEGGLARVMTDTLLAKDETAELKMLEGELEIAGPLAPAELGAALLARAAEVDPSLDDLEGLLARDAGDVAMDGIQLASLLDRNSDDVKTIRRGLVLLKHHRFADAREYWRLHRQGIDPQSPGRRRFDLLLLLMEAFTHGLSGDLDAAAQTRRKIREHPEYLLLKSKTP